MKGFPEKIYLNGAIVAVENAKVSVFDRGFIFGDGIYEAMAQIGGAFFYKKEHFDRLADGLRKINITYDIERLPKEIDRLLEATDLVNKDCFLYIHITRGVAPRQHSYPKDITPTVMMYAVPKVYPDINEMHAKVMTANDFRWSRCDIKMTSLLGNVMLNEQAMQHNCFETILVRNGIITEASHCNVFFVKNDTVYTHPANEFILNGITRIVVLQLCRQLGIKFKETPISLDDIDKMQEAFLTGTSTQIASIQQIDDHKYYSGNDTGTITKKLQEAFLNLKRNQKG
ncbi:aminotransferase class IV [Maribacter sp. MMG018]|uniref:aminotransferase class IV n=1 Tax=Maribacter sp. MMG018 TaxID=2822688 RepID=UPI001B35BA0A|nr:aminotransferase class IV [Maribacter sp. MMG018]MBQ4915123.1 aminotransferase class IV [Maribacter sp. MMG018]